MVDKVTIGILCYNAAAMIGRAIFSAKAQNWDNLEILIVDDCSSDTSVEVIKKFAEGDKRIKLIQHNENKGAAAARNTVIENATGSFICFFDDDDESLPERVATQHAPIASYESKTGAQYVLCYASGTRVYPSGYKKDLIAIGAHDPVPVGEDVAARQLYYGGNKDAFYGFGTPTCALMARTETFKHVHGFNEGLKRAEDIDLAIRLALQGAHFIGCHEKLFIQYATESADKSYDRNLEAEIKLAQLHKDYLRSVGLYSYALNWPKLRYAHFTKQYGLFLFTLLKLVLRHPVKTLSHLFATGPQRLKHETAMRGGRA